MNFRRLLILVAFIGIAPTIFGCATCPYRCSRFHNDDSSSVPERAEFVYGKPHKGLDRMAWVVGLPSRILPFHPKVNSHTLSPETAEKLEDYLDRNDLNDVLVRVNQYDPMGEWRRLRSNKRLAPGWRYTFGTATLVGYTLLPGRVFGGDYYNPFTNSLYVNSDVAAMLITEAAYAKDVHARQLPGTYASFNELPVCTLWRYTLGVNDALGYARAENDWELERETYRTVFPIMGTQAALGGHTAASKLWVLPSITVPATMVGGAIVGHGVGQSRIAQRERERSQHEEELNLTIVDASDDADSPPEQQAESGILQIGFEEIPPGR